MGDFDQAAFTSRLASYLGLPTSSLLVTVRAGSLIIEVIVRATSEAAATEVVRLVRVLQDNPAATQTALGIPVAVDAVADPVVRVIMPPSNGDGGGGGGGAVIAIVVVVVVLLAAGAAYFVKTYALPKAGRRKRKRMETISVGMEQAIQRGIIDQQLKAKNNKGRPSGVGPMMRVGAVEAAETVVFDISTTQNGVQPQPPPGAPPPLPPKAALPLGPPPARPPPGPPPGLPPTTTALAANQA